MQHELTYWEKYWSPKGPRKCPEDPPWLQELRRVALQLAAQEPDWTEAEVFEVVRRYSSSSAG
eukprot:3620614-Pyramimonas_sp.AAC.1